MPFIEHFELLNLLHYDVVETWLARESGSPRKLLLHRYPKTSGLRERLGAMQPDQLGMLLKAGEDGDYFFVVTQDTPELRRFLNWVDSAPTPHQEDEPGEFTRIFQPRPSSGTPHKAPPSLRTAGPAMDPPLRSKPATEPGEFTKMFRTPPNVSTPAAGRTEKPPPGNNSGSPSSDSDDFTNMFARARPNPPTRDASSKPPAAVPESAASEPGELTRIFRGPILPPQRPVPAPVSGPGASRPGEFTNFFNSPLPETPIPTGLQKPPDARPPAPFTDPGEFTKMFGKSGQTPQREASANPPGVVSGFSSRKDALESTVPQPPQPAGPSDYTQILGQVDRPAKTTVTPPAPLQMEPQLVIPAPPIRASTAQSIPMALVIVLAAIAVMAIALILYFVMKR